MMRGTGLLLASTGLFGLWGLTAWQFVRAWWVGGLAMFEPFFKVALAATLGVLGLYCLAALIDAALWWIDERRNRDGRDEG